MGEDRHPAGTDAAAMVSAFFLATVAFVSIELGCRTGRYAERPFVPTTARSLADRRRHDFRLGQWPIALSAEFRGSRPRDQGRTLGQRSEIGCWPYLCCDILAVGKPLTGPHLIAAFLPLFLVALTVTGASVTALRGCGLRGASVLAACPIRPPRSRPGRYGPGLSGTEPGTESWVYRFS